MSGRPGLEHFQLKDGDRIVSMNNVDFNAYNDFGFLLNYDRLTTNSRSVIPLSWKFPYLVEFLKRKGFFVER